MSKGKLYLILLSVALLTVLFVPQSSGWPTDDSGGPYYVMDVDEAPVIDGEIGDGEWNTDEEFFRETFSQNPTYDEGSPGGITISTVMVTSGDMFYVKVTWENTVNDVRTNSIGIAFANQDPANMRQTLDRKIAFYNATTDTTTTYDLFNCEFAEVSNITDFCLQDGNTLPGAEDDTNDVVAEFGISDGKPFFEYSFPKVSGDGPQDYPINFDSDTPIVVEFTVNPFNNIYEVGHGGVGTNPLVLQDEERCFFCRPGVGMDGNAQVFNGFFALLISGIFLALIMSGRNENIARKLWKVDVSEDMAKESVVMEMAYYNSSFIGILVSGFFLMYALIGLIYGIWAQWGLAGYIINGIPSLLGIVATIDLLGRNENPQETGKEKLGTDVNDAGYFWLVPTLFLAITLLMLVFIGIDVIA